MNRAEKQAEIDFLTDCFSRAQVALCADYTGITVAEVTALRKELRKIGSVARVVKNTLARRSVQAAVKGAEKAELEKFLAILDGPSFVVVSFDDPIAPAKVIAGFMKQYKKLNVKGGWFEGAFLDPAAVENLSQMPGRDEVLSKLLALIMAPATQLARLIQEPGARLARVIEAHRKNLEQKGS